MAVPLVKELLRPE
jgi:hypothetical protein